MDIIPDKYLTNGDYDIILDAYSPEMVPTGLRNPSPTWCATCGMYLPREKGFVWAEGLGEGDRWVAYCRFDHESQLAAARQEPEIQAALAEIQTLLEPLPRSLRLAALAYAEHCIYHAGLLAADVASGISGRLHLAGDGIVYGQAVALIAEVQAVLCGGEA